MILGGLPRLFLGCHKGVVFGPIAFGRRHIQKKRKKNGRTRNGMTLDTQALKGIRLWGKLKGFQRLK